MPYHCGMTLQALFPLLWFLLLVMVFIISKRLNNFSLFRRIWWSLTGLLVIQTGIWLLHTPWLKELKYSSHIEYVLVLLVFLLALVFIIRTIVFLFFDQQILLRPAVKYPKLVKDVAVFLLYIIGLLLILNYYLKIRITFILASSAVLTVILGLAVQDILGNLFSGIVLNFDDSFKLGNWIKIGEIEGRIEQFGWRSIKMRTIDNQVLVIPNQTASKTDVMIFGGKEQKAFACRIHIGVSYRNSPDHVIQTIKSTMKTIPLIAKNPSPAITVHDFGDSSIVYEIRYWVNNFAVYRKAANEIRRRIWYAFSREGIQIPFPIRDVYIHNESKKADIHEELVSSLNQNDVLRVLSTSQFSRLLDGMDSKVYGRGETIIREGEENDSFFHVFSGSVQVLKGNKPLARLSSGDFFGEISLVTGEPPTATVQALEESRIIRITSKKFKEAAEIDHNLAEKLSEVITQRQAEMQLISEQNREEMGKHIRKQSATLLSRIITYFGIPKK